MTMGLNPFLVSVAVALFVLGAMVVRSRRRSDVWALSDLQGPSVATGSSVAPTAASTLALAVVLVPFGIAFAALWGPPVGIAVYVVLLAGALVGLRVSRRAPGSRTGPPG